MSILHGSSTIATRILDAAVAVAIAAAAVAAVLTAAPAAPATAPAAAGATAPLLAFLFTLARPLCISIPGILHVLAVFLARASLLLAV